MISSRKIRIGFVVVLAVMFLTGCEFIGHLFASPAVVESIDPPNGETYVVYTPDEHAGPSSIQIVFNKELKAETVNIETIGLTMRVNGSEVPISGQVTYDSEGHSAKFVADGGRFPLIAESAGLVKGEFTIWVRGTGENKIVDKDGLALDGDKDDGPGGDFYSTFVIELGPY